MDAVVVRELLRSLDEARSYPEWREVADALDEASGLAQWRASLEGDLYNAREVRADLSTFEALRAARDHRNLARALHDSVHRHLPDLSNPALHYTAFGGTRTLVLRWLDEVCDAVDLLADREVDPAGAQRRLEAFERELRALGRSALMLSGGATLGFIHLGVVKALFEQDLLPSVVSGASMGAMVAAGIGTRTDAELHQLFDDPSSVALEGLRALPWAEMSRRGSLLDPEVLLRTIRSNQGADLTFAEALERSGRSIVISVAPTRRMQRPRVLDPLTSPDVLVAEAALASSALPVLFPPARLMRRDPRFGRRVYLASERWIDGSAGHDLPKRWLARLHNVDHVVVSQTNPYVIPFLPDPRRRRLWDAVTGTGGKALLRQAGLALSLIRQLTADTPARPWTAMAHAMASQDYTGDISLHPRFHLSWLGRLVSNPTRAHLEEYIQAGERAAWPHLARIEVETRLRRHLERAVVRLRRRGPRAAAPGASGEVVETTGSR